MIQDLLLKLIVLFLPTQLGLHFWPDFSRVSGIKLDYLSPTLYFTDCLVILYLLLNFRKILGKLKNQNYLPLLVFVTLNIFFGLSPMNSFFQYLRLLEYYLLYLALRGIPSLWSKISNSFIFSMFVVFVLQLAQFVIQHSLGGAFQYLGERSFTQSSQGLPHLVLFNQYLIRVSSVFSHPNSLAGFMLIALFLLSKHNSKVQSILIAKISILLTFSKSAIAALLFQLTKINFGKSIITLFIILSSVQLLFPVLNTGVYSIDSRTEMVLNYLKAAGQGYLLGNGLGNYPLVVSKILPGSKQTVSDLQPVHNLLLLLISELGLPATIYLVCLLYKNYHPKYNNLLSIVLITGLFDHYWVTLPQNKLILLLAFALLR